MAAGDCMAFFYETSASSKNRAVIVCPVSETIVLKYIVKLKLLIKCRS